MLPILSFLPFLKPVVDKLIGLIPNQQEREKARLDAELELAKLDAQILQVMADLDKGQAAINVEEAKSESLFKSGWRPAVGWLCAIGFGWATVIQPILVFVLAAFHHEMATPALQTEVLMQSLFGLLGLGSMRMMEKKWGVAK